MQAAGACNSPEVVAPLCDAVGLVNAHRAEGHDRLQRLQEGPAVQALGGHVEQSQAASLHRRQTVLQMGVRSAGDHAAGGPQSVPAGRQRSRWTHAAQWTITAGVQQPAQQVGSAPGGNLQRSVQLQQVGGSLGGAASGRHSMAASLQQLPLPGCKRGMARSIGYCALRLLQQGGQLIRGTARMNS